MLQGPGENAGVIAVGDGLAVAFKIESHNHPVGGRALPGCRDRRGRHPPRRLHHGRAPHRDAQLAPIRSLGDAARPILFAGVVRGIGDYGNCVGVPDGRRRGGVRSGVHGNPLVNAMCVGILQGDRAHSRATPQGVGNPIIAVGARTGRDGIHGASFASEDLSTASDAKRPRVQVGDPFTEKLLLEASLELILSGHIVAIQDMGAAGLTSSSAEMAARGDVGVTIDVSQSAGARDRDDAVRDPAQRVAGAHAGRRTTAATRMRFARSSRNGTSPRP